MTGHPVDRDALRRTTTGTGTDRALHRVTHHPTGCNAAHVNAWRAHIWHLLATPGATDLHHDVCTGRMALGTAATHLRRRGYTVPDQPGWPPTQEARE